MGDVSLRQGQPAGTLFPMSGPGDLTSRDLASIWHPYTQMKTAPAPLPIARGEGVYLYTHDGRRLLDGISSWWVNIHGHSHPALNAALAEQAARLEHVVFAGATHEPAVALAERLLGILPAGLKKIFYSDNGSTAVEVALKMAWQYWQNSGQTSRREFVALHHAYHGDTVGAMSASGKSGFSKPFEELLFPVHRVHSPYCYRCPLGLKRAECSIDCLGDLERLLADRRDAVAAVIVEPMLQAAGGMITWPAEFLSGVRRLCDKYGTLMIADEVLTGFGRTGRMFACEHAGVTPDLICLSKGLTGGYLPLAVTGVTQRIYEAFLDDDRSKAFFHGHSYTANPLACAVALASLKVFREDGTLERVERLEKQFRKRLLGFREARIVGDVRCIGGVAAIELEQPHDGAAYFSSIGPRLYDAFLKRGLLLRPLGSILYFMPPYVITD
ncbi:MAG TPA: adenosylmethionine--8-amino-7-oxononanoate transaminase, partial [Terriglobia bacterium]|nr:adenosylmethionine--8-amino-7-oxononanoate transaminase [Terriglobia bacterium]